jgi:predicted glutamine amidotransferase
MCRYLAYLGEPVRLADLIYGPANSLVHQASAAMESPTRINADGFGVGWYDTRQHPEPAVFKDLTPVWNNANLRSLSHRVASGCILAHVRAARRFDPVSRANCHPFQVGRLLWMHNGDIPGRGRLHRRVVALADDALVAKIEGNTDTELAFFLFLTLLQRETGGEYRTGDLALALRRTVQQLVRWHEEDGDDRVIALNFCVSDGTVLLASRYARGPVPAPSLHYGAGSRFVCEDGVRRGALRPRRLRAPVPRRGMAIGRVRSPRRRARGPQRDGRAARARGSSVNRRLDARVP